MQKPNDSGRRLLPIGKRMEAPQPSPLEVELERLASTEREEIAAIVRREITKGTASAATISSN
jgi:hypothetical protein